MRSSSDHVIFPLSTNPLWLMQGSRSGILGKGILHNRGRLEYHLDCPVLSLPLSLAIGCKQWCHGIVCCIRIPCSDLRSGYLVADILKAYFPHHRSNLMLVDGFSLDILLGNWKIITKVRQKLKPAFVSSSSGFERAEASATKTMLPSPLP